MEIHMLIKKNQDLKAIAKIIASEAKKENKKLPHLRLLEALSRSQGFKTHNALLASIESHPFEFDFSFQSQSIFSEYLNLEYDFQLSASSLFKAFEEESELLPSFPVIAHAGAALVISVDFRNGKVTSIFCEHESNISPPQYQNGTTKYIIVNAIVTESEYKQLQEEISGVFEECRNEGIVEINEICEQVLSAIEDFNYDTPARAGKNVFSEIDDDTELPTDQEGYELKGPDGQVLLNHLTSDEEVSELVHSEFGYLLDSVNEESLYDFLIHQRNEAIKNHEAH